MPDRAPSVRVPGGAVPLDHPVGTQGQNTRLGLPAPSHDVQPSRSARCNSMRHATPLSEHATGGPGLVTWTHTSSTGNLRRIASAVTARQALKKRETLGTRDIQN